MLFRSARDIKSNILNILYIDVKFPRAGVSHTARLPVSIEINMSTAIKTEFDFTLPRGYIDRDGTLHKQGKMRLATAMDEIAPMRDPRVRSNEAYLVIILLARVITRLGSIEIIDTGIIEELFTADLSYLQEFYRKINDVEEDGAAGTSGE